MKTASFKGGTHPPERKSLPEGKGGPRLGLPAELVVPINQHFGPPNSPKVSVGQDVIGGETIADGEAKLCVPVHAPLSGKVKKIEPRILANNAEGMCVVIEVSNDQGARRHMPPLDPERCDRGEALARIRQAGVIGMGGAGFPSAVKLDPPAGKKIEWLIANGSECEPYLSVDAQTMASQGGELISGLKIAMRLTNCLKGVVAIESNKAALLPAIAKAIAEAGASDYIEARLLKTKYPQGSEKMLIEAITGRQVPSGGLPADAGCVVQNVGTLVAIHDAIVLGHPLVERGISLAGAALKAPRNLRVPVGITAKALVDMGAIELSAPPRKIVFGGPMMGFAVAGLEVPVQKNSSGILFMDAHEAKAREEGQCIRCGRCMRACSCRLSPALMNAALQAKDYQLAESIGLLDCVDCGTCAYVCPAQLHLVQRFRSGKQVIRAIKQREAARAK